MVDKIEGIEEINKKRKSGEITDSAREAMMQAAMNKAGTTPQEVSSETNSEMEMAEASQNIDATAQAQQIQQAQQAQNDEANKKAAEAQEVQSPEKEKANERLLTSAIDQLALNNLNNLGIINPVKTDQQVKNVLNESMMQTAMNQANPSTSKEADKNMANVSQGTSVVSDTAKKDSQNIETQQMYVTGDSSKTQEAKESGLAIGVKIEQPDALDKNPATTKLLTGSMQQLANNNMNDLGISASSSTSEA